MKKQNKTIAGKICVLLGICLLLLGGLIFMAWQWNIHTSIETSKSCVQTLKTLIPEPQGAVPEERRDNTMPVISVDQVDFVGILEIPRYASVLPIGANWGNSAKYPCRFQGSVYNRTMQIGATSQKGQYDFYQELSVGDTILLTDMEGNRYTYEITNLRYEKHADKTTLNREDAALTLFIKNVYAFEYLIVSCNILH